MVFHYELNMDNNGPVTGGQKCKTRNKTKMRKTVNQQGQQINQTRTASERAATKSTTRICKSQNLNIAKKQQIKREGNSKTQKHVRNQKKDDKPETSNNSTHPRQQSTQPRQQSTHPKKEHQQNKNLLWLIWKSRNITNKKMKPRNKKKNQQNH